MPRKRTGTLVYTKRDGWCVRVWRDVEGESVREWVKLDTHDRRVAKIRQQRLAGKLANGAPAALPSAAMKADAVREETVEEACLRIVEAQRIKDKPNRLARLRRYVFPTIGKRLVGEVINDDVEDLLGAALDKGRSRQTLVHIRKDLNTVYSELVRKGLVAVNPAAGAKVPETDEELKERSVLTDAELLIYLAWQHPVAKFRRPVLERQIMSVVSRCFGGVRTGDLHAIEWPSLDPTDGRFAEGWAPRKKTRRKGGRPQRLPIPEPLRPFLRDWWERHGRPTTGLVFPVSKGERAGEGRKHSSHAKALRRDLARAFGIERWDPKTEGWVQARPKTARERDLLEEGQFTLPVDFHSWRRSYSQALAAANVNEQQAMALTGHATADAHRRYLQNSTVALTVPARAIPAGIDKVRAYSTEPRNDVESQPSETKRLRAGSSVVERWPYKQVSESNPAEKMPDCVTEGGGSGYVIPQGSTEQCLDGVAIPEGAIWASLATAGEPDEG